MKEYVYYSNLVMQFIIIILVFAGIGYYLDKKIPSIKPTCTIVFTLIGIAGGMYIFIKQINRKSK